MKEPSVDLVEFYRNHLLPALPLEVLLHPLNPRKKGAYYSLDCPSCKRHSAYIYPGSGHISCSHKSSCSYESSLLTYINAGQTPYGKQFVDIVRDLATHVNIDVPSTHYSPEQIERLAQIERHTALFECFEKIVKKALKVKEGDLARTYLSERGFTPEGIESLPLGYYPSTQIISEELQRNGFTAEEIEAAKLVNKGWQNRLIGTWRDRQGRIVNFWARQLPQEASSLSAKYLLMSNSKHIHKRSLFGADRADSTDLLVVEGFIDVLLLQQHGYTAAVATGTSGFSSQQLEETPFSRYNSITLCFDTDKAGQEGILKAVRQLLGKQNKLFVINAKSLNGAKDLAEFIASHGYQAALEVLKNRQHALSWIAEHFIAQHLPDPHQDRTESAISALLHEAKAFDRSVRSNENALELERFFWPPIATATQLSTTSVTSHLQQIAIKSPLNALKKQLEELSLHPERAAGLFENIENQLQNIRQLLSHTKSTALPNLAEEMDCHSLYLKQWKGKTALGLQQKTLPQLDRMTLGLRGLMLLAAAPNVGKTTLAVQIGLDIVQNEPDACFLFVSLEMSRFDIISRMKCSLAQMSWKTLMFGSDPSYFNCYTPEEWQRLQQAENKLRILGERIVILDDKNFPHPSVEAIISQAEALKAQTGTQRVFILIDYLQVWPVSLDASKTIKTDLDADKWRIGAMKQLRDRIAGAAVMVISEARKPSKQEGWAGGLSDVMGSARGTYTPDMVFLLQTDTDKVEPSLGGNYTLNTLEIVKGRDGVTKGKLKLKFHYFKSTFEEVQ